MLCNSNKRKEDSMSQVYDTAEEWLAKYKDMMIHCPYQSGNLIISKKACAKRHIAGRKETISESKGISSSYYSVKKGLSLCWQCPIGKKAAFSFPKIRRRGRPTEYPRVAA
jgi:hypothetical protein